MKNLKKVLALVLAVVMIMGTVAVASAKDFKDVKATDNYAKAIDVLSNLGIIDGFTDGEYKPEGYFTRAQAAKMVAIVHNAATNGKIKGQDGISALYGNAQNAFTDCTGNWAVAYINYCRATGLLDGITRTTYAPNSKLTGVQWLKLMLTTLNFDTSKEGYLGAGWDIHVLNRANEIGLLAGLADGWKGDVPVTRGEAAQILYNTLTAYLVEYGQMIKGYKEPTDKTHPWNASFVSNEQVNKTGFMLAQKMGVAVTRTTDAYRRPGYTWSYGSWTGFYMDTPKAEYKTAVTACEVLKAIGVAETSGKKVTLNGYVDGKDPTATGATKIGKLIGKDADYETASTALNYYAVDGFKYTIDATTNYLELQHDKNKNCQDYKYGTNFRTHKLGGQGDLTQVFVTEDGYVITTIHTFLGEVTAVNKNNKYSHAKAEGSVLKLFIEAKNPLSSLYPDGEASLEIKYNTETSKTSYAVGEKVLATVSFKAGEAYNKVGGTFVLNDNTNNLDYKQSALASVDAAESKTGKLTGASSHNYPETVSIDGTEYPTNCRFVYGKDNAMKFANYNKPFTFYFDSYGNVIGRTNNTTADTYVAMDSIYATHEGGKFVIKADLVDMEGKKIEAATVARAGSFADAMDGYDLGIYNPYKDGIINTNWNYPNDKLIYMVSAHNDGNLINALYSYTVDDKGVYTLTWVGDATTYGNANTAFGRIEASFEHVAKTAYLSMTNVANGGPYTKTNDAVINKTTGVLSVSESTLFLVKSVGGEWTKYVGYTALPALSGTYVDYLDTDADGFADIVYIAGAVFGSDSITGWVSNWGPFKWENGYDVVTVYVNGEAVKVNVKNPVNGKDSNGDTLTAGMYTFKMAKDANGVLYATAYAVDERYFAEVVSTSKSISGDTTAIKAAWTDSHNVAHEETIALTGVTIYNVLANGSVVKADASCIAVGDRIVVFDVVENVFNGVAYTEIYVLDKTIPYI